MFLSWWCTNLQKIVGFKWLLLFKYKELGQCRLHASSIQLGPNEAFVPTSVVSLFPQYETIWGCSWKYFLKNPKQTNNKQTKNQRLIIWNYCMIFYVSFFLESSSGRNRLEDNEVECPFQLDWIGLHLGMGDEPAESLFVKIKERTGIGDIVGHVCYRPPDQEKQMFEAFKGQL